MVADIRKIIDEFHEHVECDQLRVYHSGRHFLCEIEIVMPRGTILEEVHDVSLELQHRVEQVRRAGGASHRR